MSDLKAVLAELQARRPSLIDLGLSRVEAVLDALGRPQDKLPPSFHVAGTNGKGSTVAFLKAILEASGARVHVYTSPHLVRFNERIALAGSPIGDDQLADVLARTDAAAGDAPLSFFETATAAAFLAFAEAPADFAVIEVGLGGRLDATNVLDAPAAAVATPVALDHQEYLGPDLASIAGEKAGIFKTGRPAVIGPQEPEAMTRMIEVAERVGARVAAFGTEWMSFSERGRLVYQDEDGLSDLAAPRLPGSHQFANAGLAVAALNAAGVRLSQEVLSEGIANATWPARLQRLTSGPLVDIVAAAAAPHSQVWLDGGHNPHAARAVAAAMSDFEEKASAELRLVCAMRDNKDASGFFGAFSGLAKSAYAVATPIPRGASVNDLTNAAGGAGLETGSFETLEEAVRDACAQSNGPLRLLICGSLHLAGHVLADHA